ncbi:hypothetical protein HanPI659440_Chr03g0097441 [Helianthus annuus]|nr:hypothetical protein HanPI659440_Chr03g0097441 [Helianthus annuus]
MLSRKCLFFRNAQGVLDELTQTPRKSVVSINDVYNIIIFSEHFVCRGLNQYNNLIESVELE